MMFASHGVAKPWELGKLTIEQLHQGRYAFDEEIADAKAAAENTK